MRGKITMFNNPEERASTIRESQEVPRTGRKDRDGPIENSAGLKEGVNFRQNIIQQKEPLNCNSSSPLHLGIGIGIAIEFAIQLIAILPLPTIDSDGATATATDSESKAHGTRGRLGEA
jgi:hypothetical protein